jgi:hypothetical protein
MSRPLAAVILTLALPAALGAATVKLKSGRTITDVAKAEELANGQMRIEQRDGFVLYLDAALVVEVVPDQQDRAKEVPQLKADGRSTDPEQRRATQEEALRRGIAAKRAESEANYRRLQQQPAFAAAPREPPPAQPDPPQRRLAQGVVREILSPITLKVSRLERPVRIAGLKTPDPAGARDRLLWELSNDVVYILYDPAAEGTELEAMLYDESGRSVSPALVKTGFFRIDPEADLSFPAQLSTEAMQRVQRDGSASYP